MVIARNNNGNHHYQNCTDSACFYLLRRKETLSHRDPRTEQVNVIVVSKDVNGCSHENLNGLDKRPQAAIHLKRVLLGDVMETSTIPITFEWCRNSEMESALDNQGNVIMVGNLPHPKKKYYRTVHTIDVLLDHQEP